jgi:hypothetical protein
VVPRAARAYGIGGIASRFRLSSAKTADFFEFAISEGSHRPRRLVKVLTKLVQSCQQKGTVRIQSARAAKLAAPPSAVGAWAKFGRYAWPKRQQRPGDARVFVGERHRCHVVIALSLQAL